MRKYSIIAICLFMTLQLVACSTKIIVVDGFSSPESVTSDGIYFYVSNVGEKLKPMDKDGDGYISRLSHEGKVLERKFIKGLDAPKGMVVLNGILYVADIDRIKGFELDNGKQVVDVDFSGEGTSFLNGLAVIGEDKLLVSAMDSGALFILGTSSNPYFTKLECDSDLFGPNGLSYDSKTGTIYLCSFGKDHQPNGVVGKGYIDGGKFYFEKISPRNGFYDGMVYHDGNIIVSDWVDFKKEGVLIRQDVETGEISTFDLGEKIGGPADFYLDQKGKRLWIPMMMENKIMIASY